MSKHTNSLYSSITEIIGIDYPNFKARFEISYELLSINFNSRIRITTNTVSLKPVSSITKIFCGANWLEREIWDLLGIFFENHPDLRRILTDYGFNGYPLRKEFPLSGLSEIFYDDTLNRIIYDIVSFPQEYRTYTFNNPWTNGSY